MGYIDKKYIKTGTEVQVSIRDKLRPLTVAKMPFITPGYFRME
jgi:aminomethyltransferase